MVSNLQNATIEANIWLACDLTLFVGDLAKLAFSFIATTTKLSYFGSNQYKNKVSMIKLNVSHLLAPGLKPYVELSSYTLKGKPEFYSELKSRITKGTVALIGMKLTL
jgi:hypothetical protein